MSPSLINELEPAGSAIVTARHRLSNGEVEPVIDVFPAQPRSSSDIKMESASEIFLLTEPDEFYGGRKLGALVIEHVAHGPDHLSIIINEAASHDASVVENLGIAVQGLMERLDEEELVIHAQDTNLPERELRKLGALASSTDTLEFHRLA